MCLTKGRLAGPTSAGRLRGAWVPSPGLALGPAREQHRYSGARCGPSPCSWMNTLSLPPSPTTLSLPPSLPPSTPPSLPLSLSSALCSLLSLSALSMIALQGNRAPAAGPGCLARRHPIPRASEKNRVISLPILIPCRSMVIGMKAKSWRCRAGAAGNGFSLPLLISLSSHHCPIIHLSSHH